jgi:hypothetical protein
MTKGDNPLSNQPSETPEIQKPGHVVSPASDIQKPGHITRAYAHAVQAQAQLAQSHEELVLALQEQRDISRPAPVSVQQTLQEVVAASQTLARVVTDLQLLISKPLG